mgnify:CR=1 FL=1
MLDARRIRAPERERQRRNQRAADMPAALAEDQDDAEAAEEDVREHDRVRCAKARIWIEQREDDVQGRENERLRIRDLRPAGVDVRRPERRLPLGERTREEGELGEELRFGVPGDGDAAGEPRPGERDEGDRVDRNCARERKRSFVVWSRHSPRPLCSRCGPSREKRKAIFSAHCQAPESKKNGRLSPPVRNLVKADRLAYRIPRSVRVAARRPARGLRLSVDVDRVGVLPAG